MNGLIKKIVTGTLLVGLGSAATIPIAHNIGYQRGRESAEPVEVIVSRNTNYEGPNWYTFLEGVSVRDASGQSTHMYARDQEVETISRIFPEDGTLETTTYKLASNN